MEMHRAVELLSGYTAEQWGMVTTRQAMSLGVDDVTMHRLRAAGLLATVRHGVHALTSSPMSEARPEQAVWLSLRPGAAGWERPGIDPDGGVVSHQSAARLHGLGELPAIRIEMTVPRRRTTRDPEVWLHKADLTDSDVTTVDGLPTTTPTRTIRDLLDRHTDASHIATIIQQAVRTGQAQLGELPEHLAPYARRYGVTPGDGTELLVQLLTQIGVSIDDLAPRSSRLSLGATRDLRWADIENKPVTWGELANASPELTRQLLNAAADKQDNR